MIVWILGCELTAIVFNPSMCYYGNKDTPEKEQQEFFCLFIFVLNSATTTREFCLSSTQDDGSEHPIDESITRPTTYLRHISSVVLLTFPSFTTFHPPQPTPPKIYVLVSKSHPIARRISPSISLSLSRLFRPEFRSKVINGRNKGCNESTPPKPKIKVSFLCFNFFLGRWGWTIL